MEQVEHLDAHPLKNASNSSSMPAEVDDLAKALRELAFYLAKQVVLNDKALVDASHTCVRHAELPSTWC